MRHWVATIALALTAAVAALSATPSPAATAGMEGVWIFDKAPANPGVTMMEIDRTATRLSGRVTTQWYGPVEMIDPVIDGTRLSFATRNINDRANPTRRWTATLGADGITLDGTIWESHVVQTGRRGTAADRRARSFQFAALPPLATLAPNGLAATPPMGWSSWNKFADRIDDKTVRAMADAMVSTGLRDAGYRYVNIDDGWQGKRDAAGVLHPNAKFPDMKGLADYVHARGLKFGIYSSPGPRTCAGYEGSYGHVAQDAKTFAAWGVDYLKYDLCSGEWFYADADTVQRSYGEMGAALRATGRSIVYSLCEYGRFDVAAWGRSVGGHLWRTTGDITDSYKTMAEIGFDRNPKYGHAGPGGWNDPDMLELGNGGMSNDEYVTHMTLWAMSAAPLMMGHDLRQTDAATRRLLENPGVIAIDQDPAGVQGRAVRSEGDTVIWSKRLADGTIALALFNRATTPASIDLRPIDADLNIITAMRDIWAGKDIAASRTEFAIPGHGAVLLRVRGDDSRLPRSGKQ
jgi:alpha-galactosidase